MYAFERLKEECQKCKEYINADWNEGKSACGVCLFRWLGSLEEPICKSVQRYDHRENSVRELQGCLIAVVCIIIMKRIIFTVEVCAWTLRTEYRVIKGSSAASWTVFHFLLLYRRSYLIIYHLSMYQSIQMFRFKLEFL